MEKNRLRGKGLDLEARDITIFGQASALAHCVCDDKSNNTCGTRHFKVKVVRK